MPGAPPPWLADLPDEWEPQPILSNEENHVADKSLIGEETKENINTPVGSLRKGLTEINNNFQNVRAGSVSMTAAGNTGTVQSVDSVVRYDTVERQPSPGKKLATMEWKKRLVDGDLGYGDQTDLFGPSGLENIFQSPTKQPSSAAKVRTSNLKNAEAMPSSPPPWPAMFKKNVADISFPSLSDPSDEDADVVEAEAEQSQDVDNAANHNSELDVEQFRSTPASIKEARQSAIDVTGMTDRKISGQTEIGNETFSPVYISKHTTFNGEIGYTPLDSETAKMLHRSSLTAGRQSQVQPEQEIEVESEQGVEQSTNIFEDSIPHVEVSLPDNLPTGTPPVTRLGNFVTTQRGGLSNCGSFKTRPLSPSIPESRKPSTVIQSIETDDFALEDEPNEEVGEEAVSEREITIDLPQTPVCEVSTVPNLPTPKSAGSPLKLFGNYDTFTNTKLLRRLSQLETSGEKEIVADVKALICEQVADEECDEDLESLPDSQSLPSKNSTIARSRLSKYGEHQSEDYNVEANLSFPSQVYQASDDRSMSGSPDPDALPPGARSPFMFHLDQCEDVQESFGVKRKLSDRSTNKSARPTAAYGNVEDQFGSVRRSAGSPYKSPHSKRQRTLHQLDLEFDRLTINDEHDDRDDSHTSIPTEVILGEDPQDLQITQARPRNPTPSQQRMLDIEEATNDFLSSSPKLRAIRDKIEESSLPGSIKLVTQAKAVASEVAAFTLNVTKRDDDNGERKRSITTQDFLDEAMHIMSLIRARGRPQSGLDSVEESNEDSAIMEDSPADLSDAASSVLRISRPPSRDGAVSGWRPRSQPQRDPQVASQLQRYQEKDDMEILDATLHSLKLRRLNEYEAEESEYQDNSDVPIRITGPVQQEDDERSNPFEEDDRILDTLKSNESEGYSTGRTQGTSSTRASDNVATLAPETVAHLIPEEVNGMSFDRTQGKWVRLKQEKPKSLNRMSPYPASNITSDDDPFGNIPDLTVDEVREMDHVRSSQSSKPATIHSAQLPARQSKGHARFSSHDDTVATLNPAGGQMRMNPAMRSSTAPGHSAVESSQPHIETRATSWASQRSTHDDVSGKTDEPRIRPFQRQISDPFDLARSPPPQPRMRNQADLVDFSHHSADDEEDQESDVEELPQRLPQKPANRKVSFQTQSFRQQRRFGPDVDQSEMSIVAELPDRRVMSVSVAVSRPMREALNEGQQLAIHDHYLDKSSLILSDLPDFTVAEIDQSPGPTERHLAATVAHHGLEVQGDRYALAVQDLVKSLTDVKGDEPFWEYVKQLDLKKQSLKSLHGLEEFCGRLQHLDVAGNTLTHLDGAPYAVRWLNASYNSLSSLTAWNRLSNLQYLDISHNEISSLDGLGCLVHLRELKANNNQITSLNGLRDIEGLLSLDVSGNEISSVDFSYFDWCRVQELRLSSNQLTSVSGLSNLTSLSRLSLDDNHLTHLDLNRSLDGKSRLQHFSAANNQLQLLDVSKTPALRFLNLDDNKISALPGLSSLQHLDTLSLRRQTLSTTSTSIWDTIFSQPLQARSVHLSSNTFSNLSLPVPQHTLSHLELSKCALLSLPSDFGLNFPNLTHLNLNFNAIKDIRPLLNINRLSTLLLAENRLSRLRKCVEVLCHLKELSEVDVRDNPFSIGFYAGETEGQIVKTGGNGVDEEDVEGGEGRYTLPPSGERDIAHRKLLDEDTRLRRRVHEILLVSACKNIRLLDGVVVERKVMLERDAAWERLVELGVLKAKRAD